MRGGEGVHPDEVDRYMIERGWKVIGAEPNKLAYLNPDLSEMRMILTLQLTTNGRVSHEDFEVAKAYVAGHAR